MPRENGLGIFKIDQHSKSRLQPAFIIHILVDRCRGFETCILKPSSWCFTHFYNVFEIIDLCSWVNSIYISSRLFPRENENAQGL